MVNPYTIQLSDQERELYESFAKEHGYATLSKLIRQSLGAVIQNPSLLEPTENSNPMKILETLKEARREESQEQLEFFQDLDIRLTNVERLIEGIALKIGMSKKDIKKAQKKDDSGEVIFE